MRVSKVLKGHELFQALNVEEVELTSSFSSTKMFEQGETIFSVGGAASHIFLLLDGQVHLRLPANPPEFGVVISKVAQGEMFALSPLLGSSRYTSSAQCGSPTEILAIESKPFVAVLESNRVAGYQIMTQVAQVYFARYMEVLKSLQGVMSQIALIH